MVEIIEEICGKKLKIVWGGKDYRKREIFTPINLYENLPGWYPKISLKEGLERIIKQIE
ncbi:hypothetical protein PL321_10940 [Caloramator sp. mosi_1]|uniref:hypothetical protein n=1 Tax=Caloramator sp. mosi_1 TaxID=3023090 RepID=UPI00235EB37E|nr:hypothetical protein [Caloramator sp. mosi_1]WDC83287.1 hypothetical protein PL321_10940 [Caloramator sp. mosi_1]